jgi:hypothetical protein
MQRQHATFAAAMSVALLTWSGGARAQVNPPLGTLEEITFDDGPPYAALAPVDYPLHAALAVGHGALGGDHRKGIVVGGITHPSVVVTYLDSAWAKIPQATEVLDDDISLFCYDLDVADFDGDGLDDLVLARRLSSPNVAPFTPPDQGDMVLLNADPPWVNDLPTGPHFPDDPAHAVRLDVDVQWELADLEQQSSLSLAGNVDAATWTERHRASFDVAVGDVDLDGDLDLVFSGLNYGVRYFAGRGDGTFSHRRTLVNDDLGQYAQLSGSPPDMVLSDYGFHRSTSLADVDDDGDLDLLMTRTNDRSAEFCTGEVRARPDRIWLNVSGDGTPGTLSPFTPSPQPTALRRPAPQPISWRLVDGITGVPVPDALPGQPPTSGLWFDEVSTFKMAVSDLDGDGDVDLVAASPRNHNAAYLNNGAAGFGSQNLPTPAYPLNDGRPAWTFPAVASDWTGSSECLGLIMDWLQVDWGCAPLASPAELGAPGAVYQFTVPGVVIDRCSSVLAADLTGDGRDEVLFSNRADYEDLCFDAGLPYLNADRDVPASWDPVWFNTSPAPGCLSFHPIVELAGQANDGTSYAVVADVDLDGNLDWLDANFSNSANGFVNQLFWGLPARLQPPAPYTTCVDVTAYASQGSSRGGWNAQVTLSLGAKVAGQQLTAFAWSGDAAPILRGDVAGLPLGALASQLGVPLPSSGERLDAQGRMVLDVPLPTPAHGVWITAVAHSAGRVTAVTNALRVDALGPPGP